MTDALHIAPGETRIGDHRRDVVAIGASAGGIESLCRLLEALPSNLPAIVLVAQHRPIHRESRLRQVLSRHSPLPVEVVHDKQELRHGVCYIGQPSRHLLIGPGLRSILLEDHFYRSHNIDALFNSLALHAGPRTIGVILSGLLKDGAQGLAAIKQAGGIALVQSPEEAAYGDMPRAALKLMGQVDLVGPLDALAAAICRSAQPAVNFAKAAAHSCERLI